MKVTLFCDHSDPKKPWRWRLVMGRNVLAQSGRGFATQRKAADAAYDVFRELEFSGLGVWDDGQWIGREKFVRKVMGP